MSRFEPEEYLNDRYKAIEDRLAVSMVTFSSRQLVLAWVLNLFHPADHQEAHEQAIDSCRKGESLATCVDVR